MYLQLLQQDPSLAGEQCRGKGDGSASGNTCVTPRIDGSKITYGTCGNDQQYTAVTVHPSDGTNDIGGWALCGKIYDLDHSLNQAKGPILRPGSKPLPCCNPAPLAKAIENSKKITNQRPTEEYYNVDCPKDSTDPSAPTPHWREVSSVPESKYWNMDGVDGSSPPHQLGVYVQKTSSSDVKLKPSKLCAIELPPESCEKLKEGIKSPQITVATQITSTIPKEQSPALCQAALEEYYKVCDPEKTKSDSERQRDVMVKIDEEYTSYKKSDGGKMPGAVIPVNLAKCVVRREDRAYQPSRINLTACTGMSSKAVGLFQVTPTLLKELLRVGFCPYLSQPKIGMVCSQNRDYNTDPPTEDEIAPLYRKMSVEPDVQIQLGFLALAQKMQNRFRLEYLKDVVKRMPDRLSDVESNILVGFTKKDISEIVRKKSLSRLSEIYGTLDKEEAKRLRPTDIKTLYSVSLQDYKTGFDSKEYSETILSCFDCMEKCTKDKNCKNVPYLVDGCLSKARP
jgi:hypothetical protein